MEYRGFLYAGLMLTCDGPKVIEFNVRFGDPEAQVVMPLLSGQLLPVLAAAADGQLPAVSIALRDAVGVGVVLASAGYPGPVPSGRPLDGLDEAERVDGVAIFHAGTALKDGRLVTAGGRVLTVVATAPDYGRAIDRAYDAVARISFEGMQYRRDIGAKALQALQAMRSVNASVLILMGSDSDAPTMQGAGDVLKEFGITYEMTVASAHRSPERVMRLVREAPGRDVRVFIVGAGAAAHLAGVVAAHSTLPVIGVPIDSSALKGLDALLSTVQMPPGVPVATVSIGKPGATNAGVLAAQILGVADRTIAAKLEAYKRKLAEKVEAAAARLS